MKTKEQLIQEIRANLGNPKKVCTYGDKEGKKFMMGSKDTEFILIVTKKIIGTIKLSEDMSMEIN